LKQHHNQQLFYARQGTQFARQFSSQLCLHVPQLDHNLRDERLLLAEQQKVHAIPSLQNMESHSSHERISDTPKRRYHTSFFVI
jgi:hypothetical protein